ncbi:hypothetical protein L596_030835 [Steinernema carpocapsae]|uniref:Uncharacterized protein n=1 Tax=Steinernema carpocapsae TaxID=34508 RepID=A0A4U5LN92_STECR|nr:hypothetical protein L596_030835 [Steinernema carpocapsae]
MIYRKRSCCDLFTTSGSRCQDVSIDDDKSLCPRYTFHFASMRAFGSSYRYVSLHDVRNLFVRTTISNP